MIDKILEALAIRIEWIAWALELKAKPGLCPPECNEGHTYQWPCRARIKRPKKSSVGAWRDDQIHDPLLDESRLEL